MKRVHRRASGAHPARSGEQAGVDPRGLQAPQHPEKTFFRWRNKFGGMDVAEAKRPKELESENISSSACWPSNCWSSRGLKEFSGKMTSPKSGRRAAVRALTCRGISKTPGLPDSGAEPSGEQLRAAPAWQDQALETRLMEASQDVPRFRLPPHGGLAGCGRSPGASFWRSLGLHQPRKRPRRRRSGCDMRLPGAVRPNSVWSYDFVHDQFVDGRVLKMRAGRAHPGVP